jgi:uncharacterized membrane protein
MLRTKQLVNEKSIHIAFEVSLLLKGLFALLEIIGGILAYFVTEEFLFELVSDGDPRGTLGARVIRT